MPHLLLSRCCYDDMKIVQNSMDLLPPLHHFLSTKRPNFAQDTAKVCTPTMDIRAEDTYSTWKRSIFQNTGGRMAPDWDNYKDSMWRKSPRYVSFGDVVFFCDVVVVVVDEISSLEAFNLTSPLEERLLVMTCEKHNPTLMVMISYGFE